MTEMKDHQVLSRIPLASDNDRTAPQTDLAALSDKLMAIAGELRRSNLANASKVPIANSRPTRVAPAIPARARAAPHSGQIDIAEMRRINAESARELYATRRRRSAIFGNPELFGEPAWDILLDLYVAHVEGKPVSVSSACIGSAAPPTTGLRWLGVLAEQDLILREHDPEDQRRVLVRLTETGLTAMDNYFASTAAPA